MDPSSPPATSAKESLVKLGSMVVLSAETEDNLYISSYWGLYRSDCHQNPTLAHPPAAYPLALAAIQAAHELLRACFTSTKSHFSSSEATRPGPPSTTSAGALAPSTTSPWPSERRTSKDGQPSALGQTALTLSAPSPGSSNLILANRSRNTATSLLAKRSPNRGHLPWANPHGRTADLAMGAMSTSNTGSSGGALQSPSKTRPAQQKQVYRQSWLSKASRSPAFAISSAAINGLMLVSPLVSLAQTTTIYGTGGSSNTYTPGTISTGDTVILNDGANVGSSGTITANGTLQFNQTTDLSISNQITGNGALSITNTGNLTLSYSANLPSPLQWITGDYFDLGITLSSGGLYIGTGGTNPLSIGTIANGTLTINGGMVKNTVGILGATSGSNGTATVSAGNWTNTSNLFVGYQGNGTLTINGGNVSNYYGYLGYIPGSNGTATIYAGNWTNSGDLFVGYFGNGTLTINGGNVSKEALGNSAFERPLRA